MIYPCRKCKHYNLTRYKYALFCDKYKQRFSNDVKIKKFAMEHDCLEERTDKKWQKKKLL